MPHSYRPAHRRAPRTAATRRALRALVVACVAAGGVAGAALASANPSTAAVRVSHTPVGAVTAARTVTGGVQLSGWAVDPGAPTRNVRVFGLLHGRNYSGATVTSVVNRKITSRYHAGRTPGFTLNIHVRSRINTVCAIAQHVGSGTDTVLGCVAFPLGRRMSAGQVASHSPVGAITTASTSRNSLRISGWATDSDYVAHRSTVTLYVDGRRTATALAAGPLPSTSPAPAGAGPRPAFSFTPAVSRGSHLACVWVTNVGFGRNAFLGCRTLDTRGRAGSGAAPAQPKLNKAVLSLAEKQRGKNYVWGATGPKVFDCSGLVVYSYGRNGYTTPRTAAQQYAAARLIPASRAVPGDLVFYHDQYGNVYHVGIYVSPGRTVAAIDTQEGVNWQNVWDPSSTSYGSFTHI